MGKSYSVILIFLASVLLCASCAKNGTSGLNDQNKIVFDSWMAKNYPELEKTALGYYIVTDEEGTGELVGSQDDSPYLLGRYTLKNLDGTIEDYTDANIARQLGLYDSTYFYGPSVWKRSDNNLNAGVDDALSTMRVGGRRVLIIPGWLNTTNRYDTEEEYLANVTGTSSIYDITVTGIITDIVQWEIDSTQAYVDRNFPGTDSTMYGYYYKQTVEPSDTTAFDSGSTVYFNYTGRLLNGTVFDTSFKDTAKFYGIYDPTRTYEPAYMTWASTYSALTMGSNNSSTITGFSYTIFNMRTGEKGTSVFYSDYGYGITGGGMAIPAYSPLRFDIELIGEELED